MNIELFGIPGSGKSFYCNKINEKKQYKDIMYFFKEKLMGKVFFHLFIYFGMIVPIFNKIYKKLIHILGENANNVNSISDTSDIKVYLKYIIFIYFLEKNKKNIIIDEGIVHYCMVLYAEYNVPKEKCIQILDYFDSKEYNDIRKIYGINCEIQISIDRIKSRQRKRAPIDFLKEKELEELLNKYKEFMKNVENRYEMLNEKKLQKMGRNVCL